MSNKKTYFLSDAHLGYDNILTSIEREEILVSWLNEISKDCRALYIVGDLFDYWFEYKTTVPKGYIRLFSTLNQLKDNGAEIHYLKGNHDLWIGNYISKMDIRIYDGPITITINKKRFHINHGDGLANDIYYNLTKSVFTNKVCQRVFSMIHPTIGLKIMKIYSDLSRKKSEGQDGELKIPIHISYCEHLIKKHDIDFFIMGHYHYPKTVRLSNNQSVYLNLGDWVRHFSYAVWDGNELKLLYRKADK